MHASVVITVLRNRNLRNALLFSAAALVMSFIIIVASIVGTMQTVLGDACGSTGPTDNTSFVSSDPSAAAENGIPKNYLSAYQDAAKEYGLDWAIIAGIGFVESKHGTYGSGCEEGPATEYGTAKGPMQFIDSTWATEGVDGNGDGEKNPCDIEDAAHSTASYLKNSGAPQDYQGAIFTYNNSQAYVEDVMSKAEEYRSSGGGSDNTQQAAAPGNGGANLAAINLLPEALPWMPPLAQISPGGSGGTGNPPQGWDLVDSERTIHYQLDTRYASYFESAADSWNAAGGVSIEPSPSPEQTDLVVKDGPAGGALAMTYSEGELVYDPAKMEGATDNAREAVSVHELGHALGYNHTDEDSVMQTPIITNRDTNTTEPTAYDKNLHSETWGSSGSGSGEDSSGDSGGGDAAVVWPTGKQFTEGYEEGSEGTPPASEDGANISAPAGEPVYSMIDGRVVKPSDTNENFYSEEGGYSVLVEAAEDAGPVKKGDLIYYAHLQGPPDVSEGDTVNAGDRIGTVGSSGGGPEGTTDQREAGLHIGWYEGSGDRADSPTKSINPYHLLADLAANGGELSGQGDEGNYTDTSEGGGSEATPALCKAFGLGGADEGSSPSSSGSGGGTIRGSGTGKEVVEEAAKYDGVDYVLGGPAACIPGEQMDCTCLTTTVFQEFGYTGANELPDSPQDVLNYGKTIPPEEAQAGDVYVYEDPGNGTGGHVAIATGDGGVFHCASAQLGCLFADDYKESGATPVKAAVRLVEDEGGSGGKEGSSGGSENGPGGQS